MSASQPFSLLGNHCSVWSVGEVALIHFCFHFLTFEKLSKGEHKYRGQPFSLHAALPKGLGDLRLTSSTGSDQFKNDASRNLRPHEFFTRLINNY